MWCYLIPILTGIVGAILGCLICRAGKNYEDDYNAELEKNKKLTAELNALKNKANNSNEWENKYNSLSAELENCKSKNRDLARDYDELKSKKLESNLTSGALGFATCSVVSSSKKEEATVPFDAEKAKAVFEKKINLDDLKIVEGIGPKIEELFHQAGVKTWKALSETSVEKCQEVLNSGGDRFKIHNPETWPKQSELAYQGKWEELKKWQDELDGGKS